jgi:transcriptional regulator with XRE-family HTH domain
MKINIGENLKKMRLSKDLTQEQLAEVFGVSPQAISRWENNTAYPDITILPGIANFYETTIDNIIGMDDIRKTESINKIHNDVNILMRENKVDETITMLRDALKLYPNCFIGGLAETLAIKGTQNNNVAIMEEAVTLFERWTNSNNISMKAKSTATIHMIFLNLKLGRIDKANQLVKSLPHIWESREVLMSEIYCGDEYVAELKKSIVKALVFFCGKIQSQQNRKYGEIPSYFQLGVDFEPTKSVAEMLETINDFFN